MSIRSMQRKSLEKYKVMGIMLRWKIFNYMLENDILRNYFQKYLGVLKGDF